MSMVTLKKYRIWPTRLSKEHGRADSGRLNLQKSFKTHQKFHENTYLKGNLWTPLGNIGMVELRFFSPHMVCRWSKKYWSPFTVLRSPDSITFHSACAFPLKTTLMATISKINFWHIRKTGAYFVIWNSRQYPRWRFRTQFLQHRNVLFQVECRIHECSPWLKIVFSASY